MSIETSVLLSILQKLSIRFVIFTTIPVLKKTLAGLNGLLQDLIRAFLFNHLWTAYFVKIISHTPWPRRLPRISYFVIGR